MELEQIITLINTVSDSKVSSFAYEKNDTKITIKTGDKSKAPEVQVMQIQPQQIINEEKIIDEVEDDIKIIKSPLVGTFYSSSSPEDEAFVKIGDKVTKSQKLGIIEAMKLMNDIESDFEGEIVDIMVSNENMVEYGQPLFKIK